MQNAVVDFREIEAGIVQVTMQDREHKNTFSPELISGLNGSFNAIEAMDHVKVVVLTGFDSYFASGATPEALQALQQGTIKFTDINVYGLALNCRVPVISAMQGHALGGGFTMGLYADFVILSRESIYAANFMKYGFTPGFGATYIFPKKLGVMLGHELLFSAQTYRGEMFEKRGAPFPVYPRKEVLDKAVQTARQLAEKPRFSLIALKDHLVAPIRKNLDVFVEEEIRLHEKTFSQAEVKDRIHTLFSN